MVITGGECLGKRGRPLKEWIALCEVLAGSRPAISCDPESHTIIPSASGICVKAFFLTTGPTVRLQRATGADARFSLDVEKCNAFKKKKKRDEDKL